MSNHCASTRGPLRGTSTLLVLGLSVLLVSCGGGGGSGGSSGTNGLNMLVSIVAEPVGTNCANGGQAIASGLDTNGNGTLDASEVTSTTYVCNGAGLNTLVSVVPEPVGTNCANGGQAITSGLDTNGNGTLDASEVTSTTYVCNGGGVNWVVVTASSVLAASNTGYMISSASPVTVTLPVSPAVGDIVRINGVGTGGWLVAQNAGQSVVTQNVDPALGAVWTPRESARGWLGVASSSDGAKLVALANSGQIFTSTDSGVSWTSRDSARNWLGVASSSDGTKLVAVSFLDQIYTSTDSGATWMPRDSVRAWSGVASSSDGTGLVAVASGSDRIYTSTDSGVSWTPRDSTRNWRAVASSSDGTMLVAAEFGGRIYTSTDSGVNWTPRDSARSWSSIASSSDGTRLVAAEYGGQIYTSIDSGVSWLPHDSARGWQAVASSSDGAKLVAVVDQIDNIYTSEPTALQSTTVGTAGMISGGQNDALELQYIGNGTFTILSSEGHLAAQ